MPMGYPSQAQVGVARGLEGLFTGIQQGMAREREGELKKAWMDAQYGREKPDPFALERLRQEGKVQAIRETAKNRQPPAPRGGSTGTVYGVDMKNIVAKTRALFGNKSPDMMDEKERASFNATLQQFINADADEADRKNRAKGISAPVDRSALMLQAGELVPAKPASVWPLSFGAPAAYGYQPVTGGARVAPTPSPTPSTGINQLVRPTPRPLSSY